MLALLTKYLNVIANNNDDKFNDISDLFQFMYHVDKNIRFETFMKKSVTLYENVFLGKMRNRQQKP